MLTLALEISNPSSWRPGCSWSQGVALGRVHRRAHAHVPAGHGHPSTIVREDVLVELLGVEPIDAAKRHDDEVMPAIERVCAGAGVKPNQLERVAVSAGPGGFTGLRLAVTTAMFIAEGTGAGCVGVPSAAVVARRIAASGRVAIAVASKGESAFVTVFESGKMVEEGRPMTAADLPGLACATLVGDKFLPEAMRAWATGAGVAVVEPAFDPVACLEASAHWPVVDAMALVPIYAREPEAVTKWRQLHPR